MPIDKERALAVTFEPFEVCLERGRLRSFASATGQDDAVYTDVEAARAAGHRDLPVPPSFLFSLELEAPNPFGYLGGLGIDLRQILHAEQAFEYRALLYAGDMVLLRSELTDCYSKRGGALTFLVKETSFERSAERIAQSRTTIAIRALELV